MIAGSLSTHRSKLFGCLYHVLLAFGTGLSGAEVIEEKMFVVPELPADVSQIDWDRLHTVKSDRAVVFRADPAGAGYNMHGYLVHFDGRYWAMWSSGVEREDMAGQQVRYATSPDGLHWSQSALIAACDPAGDMRYIARGFWVRDGQLLALASRDDAWMVVDGVKKKGKYFGPNLQLHAFALTAHRDSWSPAGVLLDDTINNYEPHRLPSGEWMMSRRDQNMKPSMIIGGVKSLGDWRIYPIAEPADGHKMAEPHWFELPDGRLTVLFRDDSESFRLYRAFGRDGGRSWSQPLRTNFPDGRAKFNSLRLRDGRYVLVNNPKPGEARTPLCLSISNDGLVFTNMRRLIDGPSHATYPNSSKREGYQYPHLIESGDFLFVIYSLNQEDIEVLRIPLTEL